MGDEHPAYAPDGALLYLSSSIVLFPSVLPSDVLYYISLCLSL